MTDKEIIDHLESRGFSQPSKYIYTLGKWTIAVKDLKFKLVTNDNPNFYVMGRVDTLEFLDKLLLDLGVYS